MKLDFMIKNRIVVDEMGKQDKIYLQSLVRRQLLLLKEMYSFHDAYPNVVDSDIVGSYDALFRVFTDLVDKELFNIR